MGRLEAFLDVLGGSFDDSGPFWIVSGTSCGPFGPSGLFWARKKKTRDKRREAARSTGNRATRFGRAPNSGSGPLKEPSGLRTEVRGIEQGA